MTYSVTCHDAHHGVVSHAVAYAMACYGIFLGMPQHVPWRAVACCGIGLGMLLHMLRHAMANAMAYPKAYAMAFGIGRQAIMVLGFQRAILPNTELESTRLKSLKKVKMS